MFKKRALKLTVEKADKKPTTENHRDEMSFGDKADIVLHKVERLAVKAFAGVCIYVVVDTFRQVAVARANYEYDE